MAGATSRDAEALRYWKANPVEAVKDWFNIIPDDYQGDILNDIARDSDRLVAKSAHGAGKSTVLAWAGWHFLNVYENSRVVATAPTFSQLNDVLWPEYAKWHAQMVPQLANRWTISNAHIRHKPTKTQALDKTWFAVARTSNKPENVQGFHNKNIMIQGDEGSAIPAPVFEVLEGALSEATEHGGVAKLMLMGNPNFTAGEFYNAFYRTKHLYSRYTLTGDPSLLEKLGVEHGGVHAEHGRVYFAPRVSAKYRKVMAAKYGEASAVYDVRVRGVFPREDDRSVIPMQWAEQAAVLELPNFDLVGDPVTVVLDVARFGGDETVLGLFRRGHCIFLQAWPKTSTNEAADHVIEKVMSLKAQGITVLRVVVDEPGVGGGVIDTLIRRECGAPVVGYNGGAALKHNPDGTGDPEEDVRMFANRRSRDWWYLRRKFELQQAKIPNDETTINQLASVQFVYNEKEKIQVESKRKMRERLGEEASPDRADVIVMGTAPWFSTTTVNAEVTTDDVLFGQDRPADELSLN